MAKIIVSVNNAVEDYAKQLRIAKTKISDLQKELYNHSVRAHEDKNNYAYVGDLTKFNEMLDRARESI